MMSSEQILLTNAGLSRRLAAAVYDGFLLLGLLFLSTLAVVSLLPAHQVPAGTLWFQGYLLGVAFLFYGWFWTHGGQTLGMRAWRIRVENAGGGPLNWPHAALRYVAAVISWASVIGLVICAFGEHTALHDRISHTRVVHLPKP